MWIMLLFLTITIVSIIFCLFFIFQASFSTLLKDVRTFFFVWILLGCVNRILKTSVCNPFWKWELGEQKLDSEYLKPFSW